MAEPEIPRANVRLKLDRGTALLTQTGVTAITCTLDDLSEGGCRCRVQLDAFEPEAREDWKRVLTPGRVLTMELCAPPHLVEFKVEASIRWVNLVTAILLDMGVSFCALGPEQCRALRKTMMGLANDKLKGLKPTLTPTRPPTNAPDIVPLPEPPKKAGKSSGAGLPSVPATTISGPVPILKQNLGSPTPFGTPVPKPGSSTRMVAASPPPSAGAGAGKVMVVPIPSHAEPPAVAVEAEVMTSGRNRRLGDLRGKRLSDVLVAMGRLTETQGAEFDAHARAENVALERYLLSREEVRPLDLCRALALQTGLPMIALEGMRMPVALLHLFSMASMVQHEFVPFESTDTMLCVAAPLPLHWRVINELQETCGKTIQIFLAPADQIRKVLESVQDFGARQQRQKRFKAYLPAVYQFCEEDGSPVEEETHEGHTLDFNEGGFKLEGPALKDDFLKRTVHVLVRISSQSAQATVCSICRIRTVDPIRDNLWIYGLQILKMTDEDRSALRDMYVRASLTQQFHRR